MTDTRSRLRQSAVSIGVLVLALIIAIGAWDIPSEAGYAGVGPDFLPWVVAFVLAVCGALLLHEVRSGGMRSMAPPNGAAQGDIPGFVWVSAGLLLNALLLTTLGFILSCSLCFLLAVQGLRSAEGRTDRSLRRLALDAMTGLLIAAPVFWMFTKLLAINLPGLTETGWL